MAPELPDRPDSGSSTAITTARGRRSSRSCTARPSTTPDDPGSDSLRFRCAELRTGVSAGRARAGSAIDPRAWIAPD